MVTKHLSFVSLSFHGYNTFPNLQESGVPFFLFQTIWSMWEYTYYWHYICKMIRDFTYFKLVRLVVLLHLASWDGVGKFWARNKWCHLYPGLNHFFYNHILPLPYSLIKVVETWPDWVKSSWCTVVQVWNCDPYSCFPFDTLILAFSPKSIFFQLHHSIFPLSLVMLL